MMNKKIVSELIHRYSTLIECELHNTIYENSIFDMLELLLEKEIITEIQYNKMCELF